MSTIDRLRELEQAATEPPWLWDDDPDLTQDSVWAADGDCVASTYGSVAKGSTDAADAALIAESRNALPALLAVAELAREMLEEVWCVATGGGTGGKWCMNHDTPMMDDGADCATAERWRAALARLEATE